MRKMRTQAEKYDFFELQRCLEPPTPYSAIANYLRVSVESLYVLVSREKKIRVDQIESQKKIENRVSEMIRSLNLVEYKDYLRNNPKYGENEYLLSQIEGDRKPLQSNTIKILESLRDMLNQAVG